MNLPSIWGRHDQAVIEPVLVEGKALVTSILDAPVDWHPRLRTLGFKKLTKAWLKVGALTEAEYFYVSPAIDLVGLRPEQIIDYLPGDEPDLDVPPLSLQDELLDLWQRKPGAVVTALTMEQGTHYSRHEAWRVIEATISGATVPESETLVGLAITSLGSKSTVPSDAEEYSRRLGWRDGEPQETTEQAPAVLLKAGQSISWFDTQGVLRNGRLAQKVLTTDTQGLVYTTSPRWAGGYPVVVPEYISRSRFYYPDAAPDWLASDLVTKPAEELGLGDSAALPGPIKIDTEHHRLLVELMYTSAFPFEGWREDIERANGSAEAVEFFERLESTLAHLRGHYYGDMPFAYQVLAFPNEMKLALSAVEPQTGEPVGYGAKIIATHDISNANDFEVDLGQLAESCDRKLRDKASMLRQQAEMVGAAAGVAGGLLLRSAIEEGRRDQLQGLLKSQQGRLDADGLYRILAGCGAPELSQRIGAYGKGETQQLKALSTHLAVVGASAGAKVTVERHTDGWYKVTDILDCVERGESVAKSNISVLSNYAVNVTNAPESLASMDMPGICILEGGTTVRFSVTPDTAKLLESYESLMTRFKPLVDAESQARLESALTIAQGLPLRERFFEAMDKAHKLPSATIKDHVRQALATGTKGKFLLGDAGWQERVLNYAVNMVHKTNRNQGILLFNRKRSIAFESVQYSDEALSQTRQATMMAAAVDAKKKGRIAGTAISVDLIDIVDPELTALLAGDQSLVVRPSEHKGEGHQDIGIVQGLAMKDIRGMTSEVLTGYAESMSDLQKTKYLKKELIFPRTTLQEMKEKGTPLKIAASWDALWKGLPSKPLSPAPRHTRAFIDAMYIMREHLSPVLERHLKPTERTSVQFASFSNEINIACIQAREKIDRSVYDYKSRRIRGIGADWAGFDPANDYRWNRMLEKLTWDDLVKTRQKTSASSSSSRVQRGEVVRVGDDYRNGRDVDGEDFLKTFMFSGVEYGNWTNQKERGKHLNFAYDSMMDFATTMGWEPAALSLGGRLGLCIGSRGRGGARAAVAHFEPTNYAINLTRMRGDGSLAHEFFHAVAAHYGQIGSGVISDITDSLAYPLVKAGEVPPVAGSNGVRSEVRDAFYHLMVAIMRAPAPDDDYRDITSYRDRSEMMAAALREDGGTIGKYWSEPCEMFARAMETWFRENLAEQGKRNDYLVSSTSQLGGLYPSRAHLDRINHYVSAWIDALEVVTRSVNHPYLGDIQIPTLNSFLRAQQPFSQQDIEDLAHNQLTELFGSSAPELRLASGKGWAGMYAAASNVIYLNHECADKGTFYHEAWHACESVLLTEAERQNIAMLFEPGSAASERVTQIMRDEGWPEKVITDANSSSQEMAAYAFQLWTAHQLTVSECSREFRRSRTFIDGVTEVSDLFTLEDAIELFDRFATGDMAQRASATNRITSAADDASVIYWTPPEEALESRGYAPGM